MKLVALRELLMVLLDKEKCTLKQFQSLLGHLNFACKAVINRKGLCARLVQVTAGVKIPPHYIHLSWGIHQDLRIWKEFLDHFNRVSIWQIPLALEDILPVNFDTAGSMDFGSF